MNWKVGRSTMFEWMSCYGSEKSQLKIGDLLADHPSKHSHVGEPLTGAVFAQTDCTGLGTFGLAV